MTRSRFGWVLILAMLVLIISISTVSAQEESYTVQPGDTIQSIANQYGLSTDAILQFNGIIDPNRIFRGQVLRIPIGVVSAPSTHQVQPGETLQWIAERYGVTEDAILDINTITNTSRLTVGQVLTLPLNTGQQSIFTQEHIVQPGQTLRAIGELYGVDFQTLADINNITDPNLIQPGQILVIPAAAPPQTQQPAPVATQAPVVVTPAPVVVTQAPVVVNQAPPQTQLQTYVVQVGDNPALIADRFNVTLQSLIELNNLRGNLPIFAGDILLIPPTGGVGGGETVTTTQATTAQPAFAPPGVYIVQPGDTLFEIATRYNRNIYDIAAVNGLLNLNAIFIGQALTIN